ncbi:ectonucleotide pyrophosphatase/phosphodiesterase family member 7 isoform X1 [Tachysurus ichikawai]
MLLIISLCLFAVSPALFFPVQEACTKGRNKLLLISFDGFRWDYDRDVDTPNLDRMAQDGIKATYVTPPYITITSPSHFSLLTGRYIENHGVIHNIWFNTTTQEKKQYYKAQFVDDYWDNGSLPIWITAQRQEKNHSTFSKDPFDQTGHKYGPESPERRDAVRKVDRTVGYIRDTAQKHGLTDRLNIIITADHGMTTVLKGNAIKQIILSQIPGFSFRDIKFQLLDYGPNGMLLPKEGMLEEVYNVLKGAHPNLHVYKKEDMPARLHYSNHPRILPLILYADPGYIINGIFPVQTSKGEHGFDNQALDMKAFFRAVGPDFHKNRVVGPFETVNVYPLMCHLLGIKPEINDGSLDNTRHLLVSGGQQCDSKEADQMSVVTGLAAVVGFLVVVFIIASSYNIFKCDPKAKHEDDVDSKKTAL